MSYIAKTNTIVLEIPKCGSRSLYTAAGSEALKGHKSLHQILRYKKHQPNPTVVGIIRNPTDRLASAINHHYVKSWPGMSLDQVMQVIAKNGAHANAMFTPQSWYLGGEEEHTLHLFPFENINGAIEFIGGKPIHRNKGEYKWGPKEISEHPLFEAIMQGYTEDWQRYNEMHIKRAA